MGVPTGTVTSLFTDIEESTRLWEAEPEGMRAALARHNELLRAAIEGRREGRWCSIAPAHRLALGRRSRMPRVLVQ